jgi:hypothetical protein
MSPACELGAALMAACASVVPAPDQPWVVNRSCVYRFPDAVRDAAKACAAENKIRYRINWRK